MQRQKEHSVVNARAVIEAACRDILADGNAINPRELHGRVPKEVLDSIRGVIDVLQAVKEALDVSQATQHTQQRKSRPSAGFLRPFASERREQNVQRYHRFMLNGTRLVPLGERGPRIKA